jgi:ABC-type Fe3+ transport system substrate-binding protein
MRPLAVLVLAVVASQAHAQAAPEASARFGSDPAATTLAVRGTTDVAQFAPLLEAFAAATPDIAVRYEQWASNDLYDITAAGCTGAAPPSDLVVSSAVDLQVKLVNDGCAQPHRSALTAALPPAANWRDELFGVTEEPAVIVYNRDLVPAAEAPRSRFDLIDLLRPADSRYAGRVATYDIEASGLGYLFAFADSQKATTFGSLIEAFARTGAVATCCSVEIIDGVAEGRYLVAYNVLGSYALDRAASDGRIAVVAPEDYTLVLRRAAMIPKGAANPAAAGLLIDFMLSEQGRSALASTRLLFPFGAAGGSMEDDDSLYRPIPLSPTLLLGLDQQKRAHFLARWRATFARQ